MTHSVDISLLHQAPLSPNGLMNKMARMEDVHRLWSMNFNSSRPTWLWPPLSAQPGSSRDQHWVPDMAQLSRVISQWPGSRLITLDPFHHERGSLLFFIEQTVWIQICLPRMQSFCWKDSIQLWYPTQHYHIPGPHLTASELQQWSHAHVIPWSSHVS